VKRAEALIEDGADVNAKDATEQSAFLIAASEGFLGLLELSLDSGADVASLDSYGGTALIRAAERGHADIVGRLLQTKINVDHVNRLGWTALHEAIWLGKGTTSYLDTVRLLVAGGADLGIAARLDGRTPLAMAQERGFRTIERTIRSVLDSSTVRGSSALLAAANAGNADRAAVAIRNGTDLEPRDNRGRTPLLLAVSNDRLAVARLLVPLGANPDAQDKQHDSPWLVTGVTGSVAMAKVLLKADPDLTLRNRFGGISIIPAAERGHVGYVRLMTTTATNVNHVNNLGWTALLEAVILGDGSQRYAQIVRILLDAGADPDLADREGVTALEHAQRRGHSQIAAELQR
jgi:ankyrin repeat protein